MRITIDKRDRAYAATTRIGLPIVVMLDGRLPAGLVVTADSEEGIVRYVPRSSCGELTHDGTTGDYFVAEIHGRVRIEIMPESSECVH